MSGTKIREQQAYAFHDPASEELYCGSLNNFDWIIEAGLWYGWSTTSEEGHCMPQRFAQDFLGLDVADMKNSCLNHGEAEKVRGSKESLRLRARATKVVKLQGLRNHYEARDPATGELGTQMLYQIPRSER